MATCTFFGHRDCPDSIKTNLRGFCLTSLQIKVLICFMSGIRGNLMHLFAGHFVICKKSIHKSTTLLYWPIYPVK